MGADTGIGAELARVARLEAGRVRAALLARFDDIDLVEDAFQEALVAAAKHWPETGIPDDPAAWLVVTARRRVLDQLRHRRVRRETEDPMRFEELRRREETTDLRPSEGEPIPDERLRLVFTCCHPALALATRIALTLHTVGGLATGEVARALLVGEAAMAKRLVRARRKIREARIPYRIPAPEDWDERLGGVLRVVYLIFNAGYAASSVAPAERHALCEDAMGLARALTQLVPDEAECHGLLALLALHHARGDARSDTDGEFVPLERHDPARYDTALAGEGRAALERARRFDAIGPYQLQAAISAAHVEATLAGLADEARWSAVARLYDRLYGIQPEPLIALNRAVAHGNAFGGEAGLALLGETLPGAEASWLEQYAPYHAGRASLLERVGRSMDARAAYARAIELTPAGPERRFLEQERERVRSH